MKYKWYIYNFTYLERRPPREMVKIRTCFAVSATKTSRTVTCVTVSASVWSTNTPVLTWCTTTWHKNCLKNKQNYYHNIRMNKSTF